MEDTRLEEWDSGQEASCRMVYLFYQLASGFLPHEKDKDHSQ
jgi:hypothetical protein